MSDVPTTLHERIAALLGWPEEETHKFSLPMLRELVKDKASPKLLYLIDDSLKNGDHWFSEPKSLHEWTKENRRKGTR